jgi:hypothetical protein
MLHPEAGQRVVVHHFASRQPLQRRLPLAAPRHLPCRPHPLAVGINPQTDQKPRIVSGPSAFLFAALNPFVEALQIQSPHQIPDGPRHVIFSDQLFHVDGPPHHLLTIDPAD